MVEPTHLKHISQIGKLPLFSAKIKNISNHHLAINVVSHQQKRPLFFPCDGTMFSPWRLAVRGHEFCTQFPSGGSFWFVPAVIRFYFLGGWGSVCEMWKHAQPPKFLPPKKTGVYRKMVYHPYWKKGLLHQWNSEPQRRHGSERPLTNKESENTWDDIKACVHGKNKYNKYMYIYIYI